MFLSSITERGAAPAVEKTLVFQQTRLQVIAENVANWSTPGFRAQHLDLDAFQRSLRQALEDRKDDPLQPLRLRGREVVSDDTGHLLVSPSEKPVQSVLLHDGTNHSLEQEMSDLADAGMSHALASSLLRQHYDGLRRAIRGA